MTNYEIKPAMSPDDTFTVVGDMLELFSIHKLTVGQAIQVAINFVLELSKCANNNTKAEELDAAKIISIELPKAIRAREKHNASFEESKDDE